MVKTYNSTYEHEIQNPDFMALFESEMEEYVFTEFLDALFQNDTAAIQKLGTYAGLNKQRVKEILLNLKDDLSLSDFVNIAKQFGYTVILEKGDNRIPINA